jgi:hypothetical protein
VYLQQLLIKCVSTQLTINFHKIVNLVVLCNTFIQQSNATVGLLLATDSREGILGNLQQRLQGDVSLETGVCVGVLQIIHTKYYLLAVALLLPDLSVLTPILQDVSIRRARTRIIPTQTYCFSFQLNLCGPARGKVK